MTYTLTDDASGRFVIDETSGVVTVTLTGAALNYETDTTHDIEIRATSSDGSSSSATMTILLIDFPDEPSGYEVITYAGEQWLDRNLGASHVCPNGEPGRYDTCVGDVYQWGRLADGHEDRTTENNTTTLSSTTIPGHENFIIGENSSTHNWIVDENVTDNLWRLPANNNNVCPTGWHVPTKEDFERLGVTEVPTDTNSSDLFAKIKLHNNTGYRNWTGGEVKSRTDFAFYWTSTVPEEGKSTGLRIQVDEANFNDNWARADGFAVRCIKD